jgi:hypothetical protein
MFKHGASYLQGGDFRFHCYSIPNSVDERLGPLLKNFAAGCNWRFMQGYGKVPPSAHSAYICVYVFAPASTDIRSYRTHSKESGAREKSEWKMTF